MNLLQKLVRSTYGTVAKIGGLWSRFGGSGWGWSRVLLPSAKLDWQAEAGDTWQNSIVALGISWLGDRFPKPLIQLAKLARNGDHIPVARHEIINLWERPNPYYGRRTLEKAIGLSLKVNGNAYIHKLRDNVGRVMQLWWVPHYRVNPQWPDDGSQYITSYRVTLDNEWLDLPPSEIIHIRDGIDPRNDRYGMAALTACLREVVTVNYEASYTASVLKNVGVPGIVIAPASGDVRPNKDDAERIKGRFQESFGLENDRAGATVVMQGQYNVTALGFSPEQMALDRLPLNAISRICASLGVAPMSLGLPDPGKTYSNLGEANRSSWGTIVSIQELIAEALRWQLIPEFKLDPWQYLIEYDYSQIQELQEPLDAIHARAREDFKYGLIMLNEAREQIGLEPDPDGDRYMPGTGSATDQENAQQLITAQAEAKPEPREAIEDEPTNGAPKALANGHSKRW